MKYAITDVVPVLHLACFSEGQQVILLCSMQPKPVYTLHLSLNLFLIFLRVPAVKGEYSILLRITGRGLLAVGR